MFRNYMRVYNTKRYIGNSELILVKQFFSKFCKIPSIILETLNLIKQSFLWMKVGSSPNETTLTFPPISPQDYCQEVLLRREGSGQPLLDYAPVAPSGLNSVLGAFFL